MLSRRGKVGGVRTGECEGGSRQRRVTLDSLRMGQEEAMGATSSALQKGFVKKRLSPKGTKLEGKGREKIAWGEKANKMKG